MAAIVSVGGFLPPTVHTTTISAAAVFLTAPQILPQNSASKVNLDPHYYCIRSCSRWLLSSPPPERNSNKLEAAVSSFCVFFVAKLLHSHGLAINNLAALLINHEQK